MALRYVCGWLDTGFADSQYACMCVSIGVSVFAYTSAMLVRLYLPYMDLPIRLDVILLRPQIQASLQNELELFIYVS